MTTTASTTRDERPARASRGEVHFDDRLDPGLQRTIHDMWTTRLAGFDELDLSRYLRDSTDRTRLLRDGWSFNGRTFRRFSRALFLARRVANAAGMPLAAEILDPHVRRDGDRLVTDCFLVLAVRGWALYQSRVTMIAGQRDGRWVWETMVDERIPRSDWVYHCNRNDDGSLTFTRVAVAHP